MNKKQQKVSLASMEPFIRDSLASGVDIVFSPLGTSMLPLLRENVDRIKLTSLSRPAQKHDVLLYRRDNGQYVLHRVIKVTKKGLVMCGDNQYKFERYIRPDQVIAVVAGVFRGERYLPAGDSKYRLYCRVLPLLRLKARIRGLFFRAAGVLNEKQ